MVTLPVLGELKWNQPKLTSVIGESVFLSEEGAVSFFKTNDFTEPALLLPSLVLWCLVEYVLFEPDLE